MQWPKAMEKDSNNLTVVLTGKFLQSFSRFDPFGFPLHLQLL